MATKKSGRPFSDNPKDFMLRTRLDKETVKKLEYIEQVMHLTKSEIVRKGIDIQYDQLK